MPGEPLTELARQVFPGEAAQVGQARRLVASVLGDRWLGIDDVLVLTSEVVSNAVKHTASADGGLFEVAVSVSGASVRVEVGDQGGASVPALAPGGDAGALTGGRGLRIVEVLADRWGHEGDELGRVVWFEVTGKPGE